MADTFVWLVTGANRGLGLEIVQQLLQSANNIVVATCRNPDKATVLQELRPQYKERLQIIPLDVTDAKSIERCAKDVEAVLDGRGLDYLLNNAGILYNGETAFNFNPDNFVHIFHANVLGPALISRAFLPLLEKGKRKVILNMSSTIGSISWKEAPPCVTYAATKAALNMWTTKQAAERPDFIVICMCPGWCKTDMGGEEAELEPKVSMEGLLKFVSASTSEHSGRYWRWNGEEIEW